MNKTPNAKMTFAIPPNIYHLFLFKLPSKLIPWPIQNHFQSLLEHIGYLIFPIWPRIVILLQTVIVTQLSRQSVRPMYISKGKETWFFFVDWTLDFYELIASQLRKPWLRRLKSKLKGFDGPRRTLGAEWAQRLKFQILNCINRKF